MRWVAWLIVLFVAAVVAATTLGGNDGLVSFYRGPWRTDLSLNLFILLALLLFASMVLAYGGLRLLLELPERARAWRQSRRAHAAQAALREALALYFGGRYGRAQKSAQHALLVQREVPSLEADHEFAMLGHLLAACSLHRLQDRPRRDEQLRRALACAAGDGAVGAAEEGARLLAAEWALEDRDEARALELLAGLPPGVARRTQALRLKLQAQRLARQPLEALRTARLLAKHQGFSQEAARGLLRSLAFEALGQARDVAQLEGVWAQLDGPDRHDPLVVARAAVRMAGHGASEQARAWLLAGWERLHELDGDERAALSRALVAARAGLSTQWLPRVETAIERVPHDASVRFAAGMVFVERELWGKARRLLESVADDADLASTLRRRAWVELARMAEHDDDPERAGRCYRAAALVDQADTGVVYLSATRL